MTGKQLMSEEGAGRPKYAKQWGREGAEQPDWCQMIGRRLDLEDRTDIPMPVFHFAC